MGRSLAILAKKKADSLYIPEARSLQSSGGFSAVSQDPVKPYMSAHQPIATGMHCTTTCQPLYRMNMPNSSYSSRVTQGEGPVSKVIKPLRSAEELT